MIDVIGFAFDAKLRVLYAEGDCTKPSGAAVELVWWQVDRRGFGSGAKIGNCLMLSSAWSDLFGAIKLTTEVLHMPQLEAVQYAQQAYKNLLETVAANIDGHKKKGNDD